MPKVPKRDASGRIRFGGKMDFAFKSFESAVQFTNTEAQNILRKDCLEAFNCKNVDTTSSEAYSTGSTYFISANSTPRCTLEYLALQVFKQHTANAVFDHRTSGAEFWTQYIDNIDDIGFHWDRDYGIEEEDKEYVHPHLGTVTYLSDVGGGTIFCDVDGNVSSTDRIDCKFDSFIISKPVVGKHVVFDGLKLHGAPADVYADGEGGEGDGSDDDDDDDDNDDNDEAPPSNPRVTFLVNIWLNHTPTQSERAPKKLIKKLSNMQPGQATSVTMSFSRLSTAASAPTDSTTASPGLETSGSSYYTTAEWDLTTAGKQYSIRAPLPRPELLDAVLSRPPYYAKVNCTDTDSSSSSSSSEKPTRRLRGELVYKRDVPDSEEDSENEDEEEDDGGDGDDNGVANYCAPCRYNNSISISSSSGDANAGSNTGSRKKRKELSDHEKDEGEEEENKSKRATSSSS